MSPNTQNLEPAAEVARLKILCCPVEHLMDDYKNHLNHEENNWNLCSEKEHSLFS